MKGDAMRSKSKATGPIAFASTGLLVVLPILYVLSTGPAIWLYSRGYVSEKPIEDFYIPLRWVHDRCPPIKDLHVRYNSLFRSNPYRP
jgi:hypothetical protein